jgi:hypothetical protein
LITRGELAEARLLLEKYYDFSPQNARPRLVQIYMAQARSSPDQMEQLALFEKTLAIEPGSSEAISGRQKILEERGLAQIEDLQNRKRFAEAPRCSTNQRNPATTWLGKSSCPRSRLTWPTWYQRAPDALKTMIMKRRQTLVDDFAEPSYDEATYYQPAVKGKDLDHRAVSWRSKVAKQPLRGRCYRRWCVTIEPGIVWGAMKRFVPLLSALIVVLPCRVRCGFIRLSASQPPPKLQRQLALKHYPQMPRPPTKPPRHLSDPPGPDRQTGW